MKNNYRTGNRHHLGCAYCDNELISISTYKEMERDRIKWGWISKEDAEGPDLDLMDLGFCSECGGFLSLTDYNRTEQEELAEKVFNMRVNASVQAGRNNQMRGLLNQARKDSNSLHWSFRPDGDIFIQDDEGFWVMSPEWKVWYDRKKASDRMDAEYAMRKLDRKMLES